MIQFEHTEVMNWEGAIRGLRNPLNSWDKSDSYLCDKCFDKPVFPSECPLANYSWQHGLDGECYRYVIGPNDLDLMKRLIKAGSDHRKFMRQIFVSVDIIAPLYWWKEFDTYKVGTVSNSCSTMHKIHDKEFTLEDFSTEHLTDESWSILNTIIGYLNEVRDNYINYESYAPKVQPEYLISKKAIWYQMIQLLPSSYNQRRTITLNYETLYNIYGSRRNHKLTEWSEGFISWIKSLPYAEELICGDR